MNKTLCLTIHYTAHYNLASRECNECNCCRLWAAPHKSIIFCHDCHLNNCAWIHQAGHTCDLISLDTSQYSRWFTPSAQWAAVWQVWGSQWGNAARVCQGGNDTARPHCHHFLPLSRHLHHIGGRTWGMSSSSLSYDRLLVYGWFTENTNFSVLCPPSLHAISCKVNKITEYERKTDLFGLNFN